MFPPCNRSPSIARVSPFESAVGSPADCWRKNAMSSKNVEHQSPVEIASREIHLNSRPNGWPTLDNFKLLQTKVPPPAEGEVRVRNLFMSVDPYMRGRMREAKSYVPPFQVGNVLEGSAVGEVLESRIDSLQPGDIVTSMMGWREYFLSNERPL